MTGGTVRVLPVDGIGEVTPGDDVAALVVDALGRRGLEDGDVLVVTSKVVSKAEGRSGEGAREDAVAAETDRVLAVRGDTRIVRTRHGLVLAGAGVDASNTAAGTSLTLPLDPDASAVRLRESLLEATGRNVAVIVSDTAGRAWREGQTDIAIGAAGLTVLDDHAGRADGYGNVLAVTAPAIADEVAAAGDLVKGKLSRRPAAVVRGLAPRVLAPGEHGPGARALVRAESHDMFGLGAREAVLAALTEDVSAARGFGAPAAARVVAEHLGALVDTAVRVGAGTPVTVDVLLPPVDERTLGRLEARLTAAAFALGWRVSPATSAHRLSFVEATQ
jgi:coenzyme F420-0:L-glutamate ligase / coenzyme F420-1:gamma-L-glutamate ligase